MTPYMPMAVDSFMADCSGLTIEEIGSYTMLMTVMWRGGGKPLADNDSLFARFCRVSPKRWVEKIRPSIERLFVVADGFWRHPGVEEQWAFVSRNRANQSEKGKKSAAAKALKNNDTASTVVQPIDLTEEKKEGRKEVREDYAPAAPVPTTNVVPIKSAESKASSSRGTRLPSDWTLTRSLGQWAMTQGLSEKDVRWEADKFRDHFHSAAGQKGVKKDWDLTWKNWVRNTIERKGKSYGRPAEKHDVGMQVFEFFNGNPFADEFADGPSYPADEFALTIDHQ